MPWLGCPSSTPSQTMLPGPSHQHQMHCWLPADCLWKALVLDLQAHHSAVPPWKCCDGRVVKAFDWKSNGIFLCRFESYSQQWQLFAMARQKHAADTRTHPTPNQSSAMWGIAVETWCLRLNTMQPCPSSRPAALFAVKPWLRPAVANITCAPTNPTGSLATLVQQLDRCELPTWDQTKCA